MRRHTSLLIAALVAVMISGGAFAGERLTLNFNPDWKFVKADPNGAQQPGFDDRQWTSVSAPHKYNDIDTFDDWSIPGHRGEQNQWSGRTWYRKSFTLPESFKGRKVYIEFEAVRQVAEVYLNGCLLGVSKTGFAPFGFDLTPHLKFDGVNLLAVMCDNRFMKDPLPSAGGRDTNLAQLSAKVNEAVPEDVNEIRADQIPWNYPHWHPAHGGIYRNVRLYVTDPLHISLPLYSFLQTAGPYVYATDISRESARVTIEVPAENGRGSAENVELRAEVFDAGGRSVLVLNQSTSVAASGKAEFKLSGTVADPLPWEPDSPHVYRVVCTLRVAGEVVDNCEIPLGIRVARWDAQEGLFLNGRHVKLHGWGQKPTDEWPGLGAAQPNWMHFFTLNLMREAGGNFVRWGHCLAGLAQIEATDRLGLVVDQPGVDGESDTRGAAWEIRAAAFRDTVIYFRNHPSILIWEGGNQKVSREHAKELRGYVDTYDPHGGRAYAHRRADEVCAEFMDVGIGTEGGREIARLPVVEGEYNREESPRRVWDDASPPNFGYPEAKGQTYQWTSEQFAVNQVAQYVRKLGAANHAGGGNWIFSDSTSGGRVAVEVARTGGEVDGVRLPKEAYYVCAAMFRSDPQVHIIGHWTYPAGTKKAVYVASSAEEVELIVNGKSLGRGKVSDRYLFAFPEVSWEPGEIKAIAYTGGKVVATQVKHTVGAPVALRLTPITGPGGLLADGSDIALIDVEAVDAKGDRCPTFQQRVDFQVEGPCLWRGGYNSGKVNSINNTWLDLECGINRVAVRATRAAGQIIVRVKCEGLPPASVTIQSKPFLAEAGFTAALPALPSRPLPDAAAGPVRSVPARAHEGTPRGVTTSAMVGRFTKAFSYSGPTQIVHVEQNAQNGKNVYVDRGFAFAGLPAGLTGADWVQAANGDSTYNAVDLMEVAVKADTIVSITHDDRLPRPTWLTSQFQPGDTSITVNGQSMKVFQRRVDRDESLTLGANTENATVGAANMYIVFVNAAQRSISEWVHPGPNSKLIYKTTPAGDRIMDFSYGGYVGGGVALPEVPVKVTMKPVEGDNTAAIQEAIDKVSAMSLEKGFRGAVLLATGDYTCSGTISIRASGVVLRGCGVNASTIKMVGSRHSAITIGARRGQRADGDAGQESSAAQTSIADAYVPSGTTAFTVADASGFAVGDTVEIRRPIAPAWVHFMQMDNLVRDGVAAKAQTPAVTDAAASAAPGAHLDYVPGKAPRVWSVATAETIMARWPDYSKAYFNSWTYVNGYALYGFDMLYRATGDKRYFDYTKRYIDQFIDANGAFHGVANAKGQARDISFTNLDNMMTGNTVVMLYEYTKDARYKKAADTIRRALDNYPRNNDGGFWHARGMQGQMWIDGIFMGQMFLTRYGKSIGDTQYCWDEATKQMTVYAKRAERDHTGLYLHGIYEPGHGNRECRWADPNTGRSPEVWSEGLGWYALVMVETLADLPKDHARRAEMEDIFRRLAAGLKRTQDPRSGRWFQVVDKGDRPDNWTDTSGSAMFTYAIQKGIEIGLLDKAQYAGVVEKGYRGITENAKINDRGLVDVYSACDGVGVQVSYDRYIKYKQSINAKEAVAGFLWATAIVERPELEKLKK